jgi:hypothetical protein
MNDGRLTNVANATVSVNPNVTMAVGAATVRASIVTVKLPFQFTVLGPVANLVVRGTSLGAPITLTASAEMRNESQF